MYISEVKANFPDADVFFPSINYDVWKCIEKQEYQKSEFNEFGFDFLIWERK
jgi:dihydrofolate reductase